MTIDTDTRPSRDAEHPGADPAATDRPEPGAPLAEVADIRTGERMEPAPQKPGEVGGSTKPEPTRFGDWEVDGRCSDF